MDDAAQLVVTTDVDGGRGRVVAVGDIDTATADQLESDLMQLVDDGIRQMELDLGAVGFLDSWGLRVLIATDDRLTGLGGSLQVVEAGDQIRRLLTLTGLEQLLSGDRAAGDSGNAAQPPPDTDAG